MKRSRFTFGFCLLAALLLMAPGLSAQQVTGEIQGTVTDASGSPLPGVTVITKNQDTGISRTVITDASGSYHAKALQAGTYEVTATLEGLQTMRQANVRVYTAQTQDINIQMQIESTSEVITVTAETPLIEISRSSAASYIDEVSIENLPIAGRDFTNFAILTPTVQVDRSRGFLTMSGQRGIYTGLNVDGANNKSTFFGGGRGGEATENDGLIIAQDAVKEFKVIINEFSPEYGRSGGGSINVITKSGTNRYQGSAFFQYRDDGGAEDLPSSPLDDFRGVDGSTPVDAFERQRLRCFVRWTDRPEQDPLLPGNGHRLSRRSFLAHHWCRDQLGRLWRSGLQKLHERVRRHQPASTGRAFNFNGPARRLHASRRRDRRRATSFAPSTTTSSSARSITSSRTTIKRRCGSTTPTTNVRQWIPGRRVTEDPRDKLCNRLLYLDHRLQRGE